MPVLVALTVCIQVTADHCEFDSTTKCWGVVLVLPPTVALMLHSVVVHTVCVLLFVPVLLSSPLSLLPFLDWCMLVDEVSEVK